MNVDNKRILYRKNVRFEPTSLQDTSGRIFYWDERVFREITNENAWNIFNTLLKSDLCQKLFDAGLIKTWVPDDVFLEGAIGIVEHEKIDCLLSPAEWTLTMLWDAANIVVDCLLLLSQEKYGFKDGHTFNVQFINCSPKWIDFGSITENIAERRWCIEEFRRNFIVPLWVTKFGGALGRKIAYELIRECNNQDRTVTRFASTQPQTGYIVFSQSFLHVLPIRYYYRMKQFEKNLVCEKISETERFFKTLKTYITTLKPEDLLSERVGHQSCEGDYGDVPKDDTVLKILKELNLESVIDFRAGDGFYSFQAENSGYKVISAEFEETPAHSIYKRAQSEKRRITPVKIDFLYPTPPCLIGLAFGSSFDRLNADVSLALDFIHDAILHQYCSMEVFTEIISKYSHKASIIEFISPGDTAMKSGEIPREYSRENLIHEMNTRGFSLKQEHNNGPDRDILLFVRD